MYREKEEIYLFYRCLGNCTSCQNKFDPENGCYNEKNTATPNIVEKITRRLGFPMGDKSKAFIG